MIEPRDHLSAGVFMFHVVGAELSWPSRRGQPDRPGSESRAKVREGRPRNLGGPVFDQFKTPQATGDKRARPGRKFPLHGSELGDKDWSEEANP